MTSLSAGQGKEISGEDLGPGPLGMAHSPSDLRAPVNVLGTARVRAVTAPSTKLVRNPSEQSVRRTAHVVGDDREVQAHAVHMTLNILANSYQL